MAMSSVSAFANTISANCVQVKGQKNNPWLIGSEEEGAQFKIVLKKNGFTTNIPVYKGKVTGTFVKVTDKGFSMFSSQSLTEFADQSDYGYTFISKELMNGKKGALSFSVRQLGDSDGAWWLNQNFTCTVTKVSE